MNPYSENVFKIQLKQALGKHYQEVFSQLPSWLQVIDDFLQAREEKQTLEHHLVFPDGKAIFLETHFSKIRQDDQCHIIDLIFLDRNLPEMSGLVILVNRRKRQKNRDVRSC